MDYLTHLWQLKIWQSYTRYTRYYRTEIKQDLFGSWLLECQWSGLWQKGGRNTITMLRSYEEGQTAMKAIQKKDKPMAIARCIVSASVPISPNMVMFCQIYRTWLLTRPYKLSSRLTSTHQNAVKRLYMLATSTNKTTYQRVPQDETSRASHAHVDAQPQKTSLNAYKDHSLASPSINPYLDAVSPLEVLSRQQRQQLKTDMQRVIETILDPEPKYEILRASNTFASEIRQIMHNRGIYVDRFATHYAEHYEAQIILDANTHYEALRPERLKPLLEIRYPQALSVFNTSQFLSVTEVKDTWVQLARLYLLHPMSEHQVFAANEGVRIDLWHGATLLRYARIWCLRG